MPAENPAPTGQDVLNAMHKKEGAVDWRRLRGMIGKLNKDTRGNEVWRTREVNIENIAPHLKAATIQFAERRERVQQTSSTNRSALRTNIAHARNKKIIRDAPPIATPAHSNENVIQQAAVATNADGGDTEPATPPNVVATNGAENIPSVETITHRCTTDEAIALAKNPPPADGRMHIIALTDAKQPEMQHNYKKEYIFLHGSATVHDAHFIHTAADSGDFAYGVTEKGWVVHAFDDARGQGAIGTRGMVNSDPLANLKGIAIEFAARARNDGSFDTFEPNAAQRVAGKQLLAFIQHKRTIPSSNISTSYLAIAGVGGHGDTRTWNENIYRDLGLDPTQLAKRTLDHPLTAAEQSAFNTSALARAQFAATHGYEKTARYWTAAAENISAGRDPEVASIE